MRKLLLIAVLFALFAPVVATGGYAQPEQQQQQQTQQSFRDKVSSDFWVALVTSGSAVIVALIYTKKKRNG